MRNNLTHSIEDYLKSIYEITTLNDRASTNQISAALEVTPASVTGMVKKLSMTNPPLLDYQSHRGVRLTPEGEKIALEIIRHHRLLEMFLHQMLGYEWDEVHDEADRLEHVISEDFEEKIALALGNPSHDPHGDPIPTKDLRMPKTPSLTLLEVKPGRCVTILRVINEDPELLRHLSHLGLMPGTDLEVIDYSPYDKNLTILNVTTGTTNILGPTITQKIFVNVLSDK